MSTDNLERDDLQNFVKEFEDLNESKVPMTSGHRSNSKNHKHFGAGDFSMANLTPMQQEAFIERMASAGFRVIDERKAYSKKNGFRNIVHVDSRTTDKGKRRNGAPIYDKAGTIRRETYNSNPDLVKYPVKAGNAGKTDQTVVNLENTKVIQDLKVQALIEDDDKIAALTPWVEGTPPAVDQMLSSITGGAPRTQGGPTLLSKPEEALAQVEEPRVAPVITEPVDEFADSVEEGVFDPNTMVASNEVEVLQEQDQFVLEEQLGKAKFAGGRRPAGIGLAEGVEETAVPEFSWSNDTQESMQGSATDFSSTMNAMGELLREDIDPNEMLTDIGNKVIDKSTIGLLVQNMVLATQTNDEVDTGYDAQKEPELYQQLTSDLDNEQLDSLLQDHSNNRHDFILAATAVNESNKRKLEMDNFSQNHPVLSGVNSVGVLLGEAAAFSFVASGISAAASSAIKINAASRAGRLALYGAGEIVEQGLEEIVWAKYDRDYEFDPKLFGLSIAAGAGIRNVMHNTELNKTLKEILDNEGGFVKLSSERGKKVVDELAKHVTEEKAVALIKRLEERKIVEANSIRKSLSRSQDELAIEFKQNSIDFKKAKKGTPEHKVLKSERQKIKRQIKAMDKRINTEMPMLIDGSHPQLSARLNPKLTPKIVGEGLGIPKEILNDNNKLRQFLGIDGPDIAPDFILEGEKGYTNIANRQLKEMSENKRLNANETMKYMSEKIGDNFIGDKLYDLASTDGAISRYLFNKGNLVSSENPTVATFYNWLAPDGMGRQGASKIRAVESQQKYNKIFNGQLMEDFHEHGDRVYNMVKGIDSKIQGKLAGTFNGEDYERTVTDLFKKRLVKGKELFREEIGNDALADLVDDWADSFNRGNEKVIQRMKETGVEGVEFDATEDFFHRSWDYTKARGVKLEDLEDSVFTAMKKHLDDVGIEYDVDDIKKQSKSFSFGIRHADITKVEGAQDGYIEYLTKLVNKSEGDTEIVEAELARLTKAKDKADKGDMANRVQMDINTPIANTDMKLADILEDNFINTQKRYNQRMAARVAAAEHGVTDIKHLDEWVDDAVEAEVKRLADAGDANPRMSAKHAEEAMRQDLKSFKNGNISGLGDILDDNASDLLRFVKKYNYASLMQYVGISSIAELGGTFAEAGIGVTMRQLGNTVMPFYRKIFDKNPEMFVDRLYNDTRIFTGIGLEDYAFSNKGLSGGERIFKDGWKGGAEKVIDATGRATQGTFGKIETIGRKVTNNSLVVAWADHFSGKNTNSGILGGFFGTSRVSNRVLENAGMGAFNEDGIFEFNDVYKKIKEQMKKHASYDSRGNLTNTNMVKWDTDTAHKFGDVISAQANHIFVDPDSTTMALWQSSTVGQVLNQFRTFTINAATKVAAHSVNNAHNGFKRGDYTEMGKLGNKLFFGATLGMMSVMLRDGVKNLGNEDKGAFDLFEEGPMKALAIGLSRSSIIGQMPTLVDTVGTNFGFDPFFEKSSSIGRSRNFFNLATTPTGQAVSKVFKGASDLATGEGKKGTMGLLKASPFYRQMGAQQLFNFIQEED